MQDATHDGFIISATYFHLGVKQTTYPQYVYYYQKQFKEYCLLYYDKEDIRCPVAIRISKKGIEYQPRVEWDNQRKVLQ